MQFVVGSAIVLALIFLVFAATLGPGTHRLRQLRNKAWLLGLGLCAVVTAGDPAGLAMLLVPTLALYEVVARLE
jgi:hypothetical protein